MNKFLGLFFCLLIFFGCSKEKKEELTPLNAPKKYFETIDRAKKKAEGMDEVLYLKNKIVTFQIQEGRNPNSLEELVEKGYIEKLPTPPKGMNFVYDPKTGAVSIK
ncbi:MAG: hypothetical protein NC915_00355 [Candidatus Omnitrophica bacterium]|nr:hypothetical protein [Candidatus Omnitrophota bacterium]